MYNLGYDRAEIVDGTVFFYKIGKIFLRDDNPRIPVICTCFEDKKQCIDIAEYLGIVDWAAVAVDTPVWVKANNKESWRRRYLHILKMEKYMHGLVELPHGLVMVKTIHQVGIM